MKNPLESLQIAERLEQLGIVVRSAELSEQAARQRAFAESGGNRAMRRAAKRAQRRRSR